MDFCIYILTPLPDRSLSAVQSPAPKEYSPGLCGKLPPTPSRILCEHTKKKKINPRSLPWAPGRSCVPGQGGHRGGHVGSGLRGPRHRALLPRRNGAAASSLPWCNRGTASSLPGRGLLGGFFLLFLQHRQAKRLRALFRQLPCRFAAVRAGHSASPWRCLCWRMLSTRQCPGFALLLQVHFQGLCLL